MRILDRIKNDKLLLITLLFIFNVVYIFSTNSLNKPLYKIVFIFIGLALILFSEKKVVNNLYIWCVFFVILSFDLLTNYLKEANHHFLLTYVTLVVILYLKGIYNYQILTKNIKYFAIIVVGFAALQKLATREFISGEYYYYMTNVGGFFRPLLKYMNGVSEIVHSNGTDIVNLREVDPNDFSKINIQSIHPEIKSISVFFSWVTILFEFLIAIALLVKPKHVITHIFFILFIIGVFLIRLETGFLSILAISGFSLTSNSKIKIVYILLTLFFLALMITKKGFF